MNFEWTGRVNEALKATFGLKAFRPLQQVRGQINQSMRFDFPFPILKNVSVSSPGAGGDQFSHVWSRLARPTPHRGGQVSGLSVACRRSAWLCSRRLPPHRANARPGVANEGARCQCRALVRAEVRRYRPRSRVHARGISSRRFFLFFNLNGKRILISKSFPARKGHATQLPDPRSLNLQRQGASQKHTRGHD
jgi:hypothetical protein